MFYVDGFSVLDQRLDDIETKDLCYKQQYVLLRGKKICWMDVGLFTQSKTMVAGPSGRAVKGVGLRPLACWDCGFVSRRGHGLFLLCVVRLRSLGRADHSSRGILQTVVRRV